MTNLGISLPSLDIAHKNFCSTVVKCCNRVFALYQVDVPNYPFWLVEMDVTTNYTKPLKPACKHYSHKEALEALTEWASSSFI